MKNSVTVILFAALSLSTSIYAAPPANPAPVADPDHNAAELEAMGFLGSFGDPNKINGPTPYFDWTHQTAASDVEGALDLLGGSYAGLTLTTIFKSDDGGSPLQSSFELNSPIGTDWSFDWDGPSFDFFAVKVDKGWTLFEKIGNGPTFDFVTPLSDGVHKDSVSHISFFTAAVPETSTLIMSGLTFFGIAYTTARRRKAAKA